MSKPTFLVAVATILVISVMSTQVLVLGRPSPTNHPIIEQARPLELNEAEESSIPGLAPEEMLDVVNRVLRRELQPLIEVPEFTPEVPVFTKVPITTDTDSLGIPQFYNGPISYDEPDQFSKVPVPHVFEVMPEQVPVNYVETSVKYPNFKPVYIPSGTPQTVAVPAVPIKEPVLVERLIPVPLVIAHVTPSAAYNPIKIGNVGHERKEEILPEPALIIEKHEAIPYLPIFKDKSEVHPEFGVVEKPEIIPNFATVQNEYSSAPKSKIFEEPPDFFPESKIVEAHPESADKKDQQLNSGPIKTELHESLENESQLKESKESAENSNEPAGDPRIYFPLARDNRNAKIDMPQKTKEPNFIKKSFRNFRNVDTDLIAVSDALDSKSEYKFPLSSDYSSKSEESESDEAEDEFWKKLKMFMDYDEGTNVPKRQKVSDVINPGESPASAVMKTPENSLGENDVVPAVNLEKDTKKFQNIHTMKITSTKPKIFTDDTALEPQNITSSTPQTEDILPIRGEEWYSTTPNFEGDYPTTTETQFSNDTSDFGEQEVIEDLYASIATELPETTDDGLDTDEIMPTETQRNTEEYPEEFHTTEKDTLAQESPIESELEPSEYDISTTVRNEIFREDSEKRSSDKDVLPGHWDFLPGNMGWTDDVRVNSSQEDFRFTNATPEIYTTDEPISAEYQPPLEFYVTSTVLADTGNESDSSPNHLNSIEESQGPPVNNSDHFVSKKDDPMNTLDYLTELIPIDVEDNFTEVPSDLQPTALHDLDPAVLNTSSETFEEKSRKRRSNIPVNEATGDDRSDGNSLSIGPESNNTGTLLQPPISTVKMLEQSETATTPAVPITLSVSPTVKPNVISESLITSPIYPAPSFNGNKTLKQLSESSTTTHPIITTAPISTPSVIDINQNPKQIPASSISFVQRNISTAQPSVTSTSTTPKQTITTLPVYSTSTVTPTSTTFEPLPTPIPETFSTLSPQPSTLPSTNSTVPKKKKKVWKIPFYPNNIAFTSDGKVLLEPKDKSVPITTQKPLFGNRFTQEDMETVRKRLLERLQGRHPPTIPAWDTGLLERNRHRSVGQTPILVPTTKAVNLTGFNVSLPPEPQVNQDVRAYWSAQNPSQLPSLIYSSPEEREKARRERLRNIVGLAGDVRSFLSDRARNAVRTFGKIVGTEDNNKKGQ